MYIKYALLKYCISPCGMLSYKYLKKGGIIMEYFPKYYTRLFNGITDALKAMEEQNYIKAQDILIRAQQDAEEMYLDDGDDEETE